MLWFCLQHCFGVICTNYNRYICWSIKKSNVEQMDIEAACANVWHDSQRRITFAFQSQAWIEMYSWARCSLDIKKTIKIPPQPYWPKVKGQRVRQQAPYCTFSAQPSPVTPDTPVCTRDKRSHCYRNICMLIRVPSLCFYPCTSLFFIAVSWSGKLISPRVTK